MSEVIPSDVNGEPRAREEDRGLYSYLLTAELQYQHQAARPARPFPQTRLYLTKIKIQHKG